MSQQGTPTASEQVPMIGRVGMIDVESDFTFAVRVLEAKTVWHKTQYLVTPVAGSGGQWVTEARLRFPEPVEATPLGDGIEDAEIVG